MKNVFDWVIIVMERNRRGDIRYSNEWPEYCNWQLPVTSSSSQSDQCQSRSIADWHAYERGLIPESSDFDSASIIEWHLSERRPIIGANCPKHRNYYTVMSSQLPLTPQVIISKTSPANGVISMASSGGASYIGSPTKPTNTSVKASVPLTAMASYQEEEGIDCSPCCRNDIIRRTFRNIVYGQILSLCLCGTGVGSQLLSKNGVNTPAAQSFLNYFLLSFIYGTMLVFRKGENSFLPVVRKRGWRYLLLAIVDVQANYIIVYAYQFTNLTSVQLLDCSTIPMVLLLSWLFLSTRYLLTHIIGVGICLVGIAVLIWADALEGKGSSGDSNRVLGDVLCLTGSILYAVGNVGEEFLVKQNSRVEYLGMVGLFGSIISGIQLAALEHRELASVNWSGTIVVYYLLFAACMFLFYSLVSVVVQKASALMFNLSILTADFYTLIFGIFMFKYEFHPLYFASFSLVIIGSLIYSIRETERRDSDEPRNICCLLCHCCTGGDNQSPHIPQQFFLDKFHFKDKFKAQTSSMRSGSGIGIVNNTAVYGETAAYPRFTNIRNCPVHGRQVPFLQQQQPNNTVETYA
uniref:Solute carrier family 35 member F1 n=1 Tax=Elaeophora elaphi TaxID=1147741 RepID=A0A0R3RI81_9BILA